MVFKLFKRKTKDLKEQSYDPDTVEKTMTGERKVFEDAFMEIQEGMLSLCTEFAGDTIVDEIYVYGSIEEDAYSFNAFYVKHGQVLATHKINPDLQTIRQFLNIGAMDLVRLAETCRDYGRPVPTELRLHYTFDGGHLDAHYEYESVCNPENRLSPTKVLHDWQDSVEKAIQQKHN